VEVAVESEAAVLSAASSVAASPLIVGTSAVVAVVYQA
jgi:hypothetical protein